MQYSFSKNNPPRYLLGFRSELNSWSERGGRLDTPLITMTRDEMGNAETRVESAPKGGHKIVFQPQEWIINESGGLSQPIPLNHPSLKPAGMILNARGRIVSRINGNTTRMGRCLNFIAPNWPAGTQRPGAKWDEPTEWVEMIGDWKIIWKGKLHWKVAGVQRWESTSCLHLTYTADVKPSIAQIPGWAKGGLGTPTYSGTGSGDACFDRKANQIEANNFIQEGVISIPIDNVYRIPPDIRVGRTPRHRWGESITAERGTLRFQIKNRLGVHKS